MRHSRFTRGEAPPTPPVMELPHHSPARKISGQRSSSPSPNRHRLSSALPKNQLGNFAKLFAALDTKLHNGPAEQHGLVEPGESTASASLTLGTLQRARHSPSASLSRQRSPKTPDISRGFTHGSHMSTKNPSAQHTSLLHGQEDTHDNSRATVSPSRNQFAVLADSDAHPPITPPTSDDDDTLFPPYDDDTDGFPTKRKNSATSTCITTPGTNPVQRTSTIMLGSNLEQLLSSQYGASSNVGSAVPDAAVYPTTPKSKITTKISPSSENGQRLFDHRSSAAKLAPLEKRVIEKMTIEAFKGRVDKRFMLYDENLKAEFSFQLRNGVYIFIDWSNFLIGCRETVRQLRGMGPLEKLGFWVNFDRVKYLIERQRPIKVRDLAGSRGDSQAANDQLDYIKTKDYHVMDPQRRRTASSSDTEDTVGRKAEQCVDELLQLQMLHALYDVEPEDRGVLVLASGDGQDAEFSAGGFLKMVERALKAGWCVELYAFSCSISSVYLDLESRWPSRLTVHLLDDVAEALVEQE